MLDNFHFVDLEFYLRFEQPLIIGPGAAGPMLRGAFGTQLRRIVCHDPDRGCWDCSLRLKCAYEKIFSPHVTPAAERLRKERDVPRGFVLKPPLEGGEFGPERPFSFRMILVGELIQWLPYIIVPFSELGRVGIGRGRIPYRLERIASRGESPEANRQLYKAVDDRLVRDDEMIRVSCADLVSKRGDMSVDHVTIHFLTPTTLRHNPTGRPGESKVVRVPEFHVLVKRLRDRVNRLATAYCGQELDLDYRAFGERAEKVQTEAVRGRWLDRTRTTRSGKSQDLGGFVGEVTFTGSIGEFLPVLLLGQYLHVGKNAVFGNGWYELEGTQSP